MKKIGIVTFYYGSSNYGGLLQAYALANFLVKKGYDAKQICVSYQHRSNTVEIKRAKVILKKNGIIKLTNMTLKKIKRFVLKKINTQLSNVYNAKQEIRKRELAVEDFRTNCIPHTMSVYNQYNIEKCEDFDIYITGSDQVWRQITTYEDLNTIYWLSFVPLTKKKISYAASLSRQSIPEEAVEKVSKALYSYHAISVREESDKKLIESIINKKVEWVMDPTLLFTEFDWRKVAYQKRIYDKEYVFAYLLGDDVKVRRWIKRFAHQRNIEIVFIPYILNEFRYCDRKFGDDRLSEITPEKWLSLIRDAKYIITDSFHGTVFSILFRKQFFVFRRDRDSMSASSNTRIYSLLSLLNLDQRLIDVNVDQKTVDLNNQDIDYERVHRILYDERIKSEKFLIHAIEDY